MGPITYFLEPGFIADPDMGAQWYKTRTENETDNQFISRVQGVLEAWYLNPTRGFAQYDTPGATGGGGFMTAGRLVAAGQFPSRPTDTVLSAWNATNDAPRRSPRAGLIGSQASPSRSPNAVPPPDPVAGDGRRGSDPASLPGASPRTPDQ